MSLGDDAPAAIIGPFEALADSAPDAIVIVDSASTILFCNPAVERVFGYLPDELVDRPLTDLIPERLRSAHSAGMARYLASGQRRIPWTGVSLPGLRKDGREIPLEISFGEFTDAQGDRVFSGFMRDVSDRENQRAALAAANVALEKRVRDELTMRALAQSIAGASNVAEAMHHVVESARNISGSTSAFLEQVIDAQGDVEVVAAIGEGTPDLGVRVPYPGSLTEEVIERREPALLVRMEGYGAAMAKYLAERCSGCSAFVVPLFGTKGVIGTLVLLRHPNEPAVDDSVVSQIRTLGNFAATALQRMLALAESERRRLEAETAVRSRDDVLAVVSHDLKNPLNAVLMSASLLRDADVRLSAEDQAKQLAVIERSARRMNRLIDDLLSAARIEGGRLTLNCRCEDLRVLGLEAVDSFRPMVDQKQVRLRYDAPAAVPRVFADRDRIMQALSNLLNNAVKFTPSGGEIVVRVTLEDGGAVRIAVQDTGPGIASDQLPHVFSRFWQARKTAHMGSGLGLAITKGIVEAHRGSVWVTSTPGSGSTFYLELPASRECA